MISVILPCYNAVAHLPRALQSVRAQTFSDIEIIVVDDGSTDRKTIDYLDALPADVTVLRQDNQGLPGARNAGFRAARGKFVVPLDCDDWLEPDFLARTLDALIAEPGKGFAFAHLALEGEASGAMKKGYNFFEQLCVNQLPYCMMFRRDLWDAVGGYDETMRYGYEDWEFNIRLGGHGHHGIAVMAPLFHYQVSSQGMLQSISSARHGQLWRDIQQRNPALYRLPALLRCWRQWRGVPSTYPLAFYFGWLALHRLLPVSWFAALFRHALGVVSHARRASRAAG